MKDSDIDRRVREEIQKVFPAGEGVDRLFFPERSSQVSDRPALTLIIMGPDQSVQGMPEMPRQIEAMTREYGQSARTYKSALLWVVPDTAGHLRDEARKLLAWEDIHDEGLPLDETQQKQLDTNIKKARRDLTEGWLFGSADRRNQGRSPGARVG